MLNAGALVWVAPALGVCLLLIIRERGWQDALRPLGAFVGFLALFALPTIVAAPAFLTSNIVSFDPIANLGAPLNPIQLAGIWPAGDFRADSSQGTATRLIIALAALAAVGAAVWAARRGFWALPTYVVGAVASAVALWAFSTPWIEAKAFATAAPAIPFAAVVGAALLASSGRVIEGAAIGAVVVGAVLWSNVLQYHDAWLAPYDQLAELEDIGEQFRVTVRRSSTSTSRTPSVTSSATSMPRAPLSCVSGRFSSATGGSSTRRSTRISTPTRTTPCARIGRSCSGARRARAVRPRTTSACGQATGTRSGSGRRSRPRESWPMFRSETGCRLSAEPTARRSEQLAKQAGEGGHACGPRSPPKSSRTSRARCCRRAGQPVYRRKRLSGGQGRAGGPRQRRPARSLRALIAGSFRNRLEASVDGVSVARPPIASTTTGCLRSWGGRACDGNHTVRLSYSGADWRPGTGGAQFAFGPLVLAKANDDRAITYVDASAARSLCGKPLDWVEALAR